jgi:predicted esterase
MTSFNSYKIYFIPGLQEKNPTKYKTLDLSIDDVLNLPKIPKDSILIGFSIGATIAYLISLKQPVKRLILCSPSPLIVKYKMPKCKEIYLIEGNKEHGRMIKYSKYLSKKIKAKYVEVNAPHKLNKAYLDAIDDCLN